MPTGCARKEGRLRLSIGVLGALAATAIAFPAPSRAAFHEPVNAPLNSAPGHSAIFVAIADLGGTPGVGWIETNPAELHVAKLSGGGWTRLGSVVSSSASSGHPLSLGTVGGAPVVAWTEATTPGPPAEAVQIASFDGTNWNRVGASLAAVSTDNTFESRVMGLASGCPSGPSPCPLVAFGDQTSGGNLELHVSYFDGMTWNPFSPIVNTGHTSDLFDISQIAQGADGIYVAWYDATTDVAHVGRLGAVPVWTDFPIGNPGASAPSLAIIGGIPYVAWSENSAGASYVHVARLDTSTDTFKAVGGLIGSANKLASAPAITGVGGMPYVAYNESNVSGQPDGQNLIVRFDGSGWVQIGGPLNHVSSDEVGAPQITTVAGVPYVAWLELDQGPPSFHSQVRVARYVAPRCSPARVAVKHDSPERVTLSCSDGSVDALRLLTGPSHGSLSALAGGAVTYTPKRGYAGKDSFTYTGNDGATLSRLRIAKAFRAASSGTSIVPRLPKSRTRHEIGSAVTFSLSHSADVVFSIEAVRTGVRHGRKCLAGHGTGRRRCSRFVPVRGHFSINAAGGRNRLLFSGRLGGRALAPGSYRLVARPKGGLSVVAAFRIVRS
jgi:hypothetical protein